MDGQWDGIFCDSGGWGSVFWLLFAGLPLKDRSTDATGWFAGMDLFLRVLVSIMFLISCPVLLGRRP